MSRAAQLVEQGYTDALWDQDNSHRYTDVALSIYLHGKQLAQNEKDRHAIIAKRAKRQQSHRAGWRKG